MHAAVEAARRKLGGEVLEDAAVFWQKLRDRQLPFFGDAQTLWRLSLPAAYASLVTEGTWLIEWGGAQRWLKTRLMLNRCVSLAERAGGHATQGQRLSHALPDALLALHRKIKLAFDPHGIFNPGLFH